MKVVLCDDHELFLESLAMAVRARGHDVIPTRCPVDAVAATSRCAPDVCVLDLHYDVDDGDEPDDLRDVVAALRALRPATAVLVLTGEPASVVAERLRADRVPVLEKSTNLDRLLRSLEAAGGAGTRLADPGRDVHHPRPATSGVDLTARERQVLDELVRGRSTRNLALDLGVRPSTARAHVQALLDKLGVHSRLEAVAHAVRHGMVDLDHMEGDR